MRIILFVLFTIVSATAAADALCSECKVHWLDSELANGDVRVGLKSGTGPCNNMTLITVGSLNERQKNQMISMLMAAAMSGAEIDAHGTSADCGSFNLVSIYGK